MLDQITTVTAIARSFFLILPLILNACATSDTGSGDVAMGSRSELIFFDADVFDSSLGKTFAGKPEAVRVVFAAPTSLNAIPPRINVWLTEIKKSDGRVQMAPIDPVAQAQGKRGIGLMMIFDLIDVILTARERIARNSQLSMAHAYDAVIIYDTKTGVAKEVTFQRRKS